MVEGDHPGPILYPAVVRIIDGAARAEREKFFHVFEAYAGRTDDLTLLAGPAQRSQLSLAGQARAAGDGVVAFQRRQGGHLADTADAEGDLEDTGRGAQVPRPVERGQRRRRRDT